MFIDCGVEAVNMTTGEVILGDGTILPITDYFDSNGNDCDPDEAVAIVAGTDEFGWIDYQLGEPETVH